MGASTGSRRPDWRSSQARSDDLLAGFTPPQALLAGSAESGGEGFEAVLGDEPSMMFRSAPRSCGQLGDGGEAATEGVCRTRRT